MQVWHDKLNKAQSRNNGILKKHLKIRKFQWWLKSRIFFICDITDRLKLLLEKGKNCEVISLPYRGKHRQISANEKRTGSMSPKERISLHGRREGRIGLLKNTQFKR